MNYFFTINDEIIKGRPDLFLYTGNVGMYNFCFEFNKIWDNLIKFAVFITPETSYTVKLEDNMVGVPSEILTSPTNCSFGLYATNGEDDIKRISTNLIEFEIQNGAYTVGETPAVPTADIWENIFAKSIPIIRDGKWYLYDIKAEDFVDTGVCATGPTPQKGVDYWTVDDQKAIVQDLISLLPYGDEVSY